MLPGHKATPSLSQRATVSWIRHSPAARSPGLLHIASSVAVDEKRQLILLCASLKSLTCLFIASNDRAPGPLTFHLLIPREKQGSQHNM